MSGERKPVRLVAHLWSQLDGLADGLGQSPDAVVERAVLTLLALHGYQVSRRPGVVTTEPGVPPFKPRDPFARVALSDAPPSEVAPQPLGAPAPTRATRVEGVARNAPVITGVVVGQKPGPTARAVALPLKQVPPTSNLRAPGRRPASGGLDEDAPNRPTQLSPAHAPARVIPSEALASAAVDSGSLPEPVAAGELMTSPRRAQLAPTPPRTKFPEAEGPDDEAPFVSDVISVPPELYAPDGDAPLGSAEGEVTQAASEEVETPSEETEAAEVTHGVSEETHGVSEETHGVSEETHAEVTQAPSEAFTAPRSDPLQPVSETFLPPVSELTQAPVSAEVAAPASEVTEVPSEVLTHGALSEEFSPPASELESAPEEARESATQGLSPEDVPWQLEPEPPAPERAPADQPAAAPLAQYVEEAPPPPPPDPDADPARRTASDRIHAIAAELEQWVLPREDRSFNIDLPAAGQGSPPA